MTSSSAVQQTTRSDLLKMALDAVERRPKSYGAPEQNFERIAALWSVYVRERLPLFTLFAFTPSDIANMMVLMKVARLQETPDHIDSWTDIAGYAACGAEVATAQLSVGK